MFSGAFLSEPVFVRSAARLRIAIELQCDAARLKCEYKSLLSNAPPRTALLESPPHLAPAPSIAHTHTHKSKLDSTRAHSFERLFDALTVGKIAPSDLDWILIARAFQRRSPRRPNKTTAK